MKPRPGRQRPQQGRAAWLGVAVLAAALALFAWWQGALGELRAATPAQLLAPQAAAPAPAAAPSPAAAPASRSLGAPLSPLGLAQRREQLELWQGRLERAREALQGYQAAAQYPHESRPLSEHPDQLRPFAPITEERALRMPGGSTTQGVRLRTTQERVFASGMESNRITITLTDEQGRTLPLRVQRAVQKEVTPPGATARTAEVALAVNDTGTQGDLVAGDGTWSVLMQPGAQGFAGFAGTVRLELNLEYAGQPGFLYFDLVYSPEQAATWLPGVREAATPAGLDFFVKAQVHKPGRYVVTGRVDDARGTPVALVQFNGEVGAGAVEFKLPVFGKLIRDAKPEFPLVLRDVEGFLLKPDTFPDRVMLARRIGEQHRSRSYALASFSEAEWQSEERTRYLTELGKDVAEAEQKVRQLQP
ncbi:hypothetical protein [Rubrivivax rivuli]|uniref:Uncharacterized protein n=1 Tax=Rubrivivax rivuli TaxID=1862385 RepID=A0A437RKA4_9BURK|nr:hypothetical protein [Rubrivivax rivuli]RVU47197.1 hypothetical protein EOE66_05415 [Rubrivivax rivuli]